MALRTKHVPNNHFFPTAYIAVSGGSFCPCEEAASVLKWPRAVCRERRFKIFDLDVGAIGRSTSNSEVPMMQAVYSSLKGLVRIHNPSLLITLEVTDPNVRNALKMAAGSSVNGTTTLVVLPRSAVPKVHLIIYKFACRLEQDADLREHHLRRSNRVSYTHPHLVQSAVGSNQKVPVDGGLRCRPVSVPPSSNAMGIVAGGVWFPLNSEYS